PAGRRVRAGRGAPGGRARARRRGAAAAQALPAAAEAELRPPAETTPAGTAGVRWGRGQHPGCPPGEEG
ncbi:MAG TPA: hypothetical protein VNV66_11430, partial [Pilimelia sp.]|nr:hypothetical protein [Pilimelia sp.]